jgi:GT2 family glycosyltransferase/2-phospho-L-lactate transferase/gluconeogenesis factor (CofD/UPF0052 family)
LNKKPFVSIVVASYNRKYIINETIKSLINLEYPTDKYEIVLIDNFSSDGTVVEVEKNFRDDISSGLLKIVPLTYNSGSSGSYVEALNYINPDWEYMLKMDEDLILDKSCLKELVNEAIQSDKISVVGGKVFFYKERDRFHAIGSKLSHWFAIAKGIGVNQIDEGQFDKRLSLDALNGCMILISKKLFTQVGWFDTDYFLYYDDHDLMYKSKQAGFDHIYTPLAVGYHDTATGTKKKYSNKLWLYYSVRGSWLFLFKNFNLFSFRFLIYSIIHNIKFIIGLFYLVLHSNRANLLENMSIYLTGYFHGLIKKTGFYDLDKTGLKVVIFSGGRGSGNISNGIRDYARSSSIKIEVNHITNAYDDGKSTGEVRRFYNHSVLGPSDVRKIQEKQYEFFHANTTINKFLSLRLDGNKEDILQELKDISEERASSQKLIYPLFITLPPGFRKMIVNALKHFFSRNYNDLRVEDFALSNLIYASLADLHGGLHFAEEIFKKELNIPDTVILNSEENSYTYALTEAGHLLHDEASIVDYSFVSPIYEVYLSSKPLSKNFLDEFANLGGFEEKKYYAESNSSSYPPLSSSAKEAIELADIIIYGPGTQYSSLYPTYFTENLTSCIKRSRAYKIFVTNIHHDNETPGFSAVDQVRQAIYYLNQKGLHGFTEEDLIDVMILNEPESQDPRYIRPNRTELDQLNIKNILIQNIESKDKEGSHDSEVVSNLIFNSFRTRWK